MQRGLFSRLDLLAASVKAAGPRIVVYNGLPWKRSGMVEVPGQPGRVLFVADVPANGYKVLAPKAEPAFESGSTRDEGTLDTSFYRVQFDLKRGGIASLVEKKTGRELVDSSSPYALGQSSPRALDAPRMHEFVMAYTRPPGAESQAFLHSDTPKDLVYGTKILSGWSLAVARSAVADVATLTTANTAGLAESVKIFISFFCDRPAVEVEWQIADKTPDPIPEGGWLCFPLAVKQPHYTLGRLGGPIDPARQIVPGANKDYFCLSTGLTIRGDDPSGVGLCPIDSPCVSLGEPGLWRVFPGLPAAEVDGLRQPLQQRVGHELSVLDRRHLVEPGASLADRGRCRLR